VCTPIKARRRRPIGGCHSTNRQAGLITTHISTWTHTLHHVVHHTYGVSKYRPWPPEPAQHPLTILATLQDRLRGSNTTTSPYACHAHSSTRVGAIGVAYHRCFPGMVIVAHASTHYCLLHNISPQRVTGSVLLMRVQACEPSMRQGQSHYRLLPLTMWPTACTAWHLTAALAVQAYQKDHE
jgi:hypothetical protein